MRFGPRSVILWTSLIQATMSLVAPLFCNIHWTLLLLSRIIVGVCGGATFPACHTMVARWAPPNEKSRFVWSLLGGTFGTIFTYPMVGAIAENFGWEWGWYIPAVLYFVWILIWIFFAYDTPMEHPGIDDDEKKYIVE